MKNTIKFHCSDFTWECQVSDDRFDHQNFLMESKVVLMHPTGNFSYFVSDLSFDVEEWNNFCDALDNLKVKANIASLSQEFSLSVQRIGAKIHIQLSINESLGGAGMITLNMDVNPEEDCVLDM